MNKIKSNSTMRAKLAGKHKLMLFGIVAIFAIALALPATLGFANEYAQDSNLSAEANDFSISGKVLKNGGSVISDTTVYVQLFGTDISLEEGYSDQAIVDPSDGSYSFSGVPEDIIFGVMIAGDINNIYAWQFRSLPTENTTGWDFYLSPGATWTFPVDPRPEGLDTYAVCGGTSIITVDGYEIPWTSLMPSIPMGDMPQFGLHDGATITESKENKTLTYHYKSTEPGNPEECTLVFVARADETHNFINWQINDKDITEPYKVKAGDIIKVDPIFGNEPDPPEPGEVRAHIYEDSARPPATPIPVKDAYAYIVGFYSDTGEVYASNYGKYNNETGLFKIKEVPDNIMGFIVVGAPGHTNRAQYYSSSYPATNFYLSKGVQCTVEIPEGVDKVLLEEGSNIQITLEGYELKTLELPYDIDFTDYILPFGMSFNGTFDFMDNGELNFSFDRNSFDIGHLSLTFKVVSKEGYVQDGWLKDGQKISGKYEIKEGEKDFTIAPNYGSDEPQEPTVVNAQTFDSLSTCIAVLAFLIVASAGILLYRRFSRK